MKIIGVTGSKGKTTTTWMIRSILRRAGSRVGMLGTVEYDLGDEVSWSHHTTPSRKRLESYFETMRRNGCEYCVMELASESYSDNRLAFLHPDMVVLTSVLPGYHLSEHGSHAEYRHAKERAVKSCKKGGLVFANRDDVGAHESASRAAPPRPIIWYGEHPEAFIRASAVFSDRYGTVIQIGAGQSRATIQTRLIGRHQAHNAAAASAVCLSLGVAMRDVIVGIESMAPVPSRLDPVADYDGVRVIVDFSHPAAAMDSTLRSLREVMGDEGRILGVFGWTADRAGEKRRNFGKILSDHCEAVFLTSDNAQGEDPRDIAEQIREGMSNPEKSEIIIDRSDAIERAVAEARTGDCVLLLGRGHDLVQEIDGGYATIQSDAAVARAAARRRTDWRSIA